MARDNGPITDQQREKLEEDLAAALLMIYAGKRAAALARLGQQVDALDVPPDAAKAILVFATERARLIQVGINQRMAGADDAAQVQAEIDQYNSAVLQPYLQSWASHQGTIDAYSNTPAGDGSAATRLTTQPDGSPQLWAWQQNTDYTDDCTEAMNASPAPFDDLMGIAGNPPPVHPRCQCTLSPA